MIEQLASLLLPIDSLISHPDFEVQHNASATIVSLYRNLWFLITLFDITNMGNSDKDSNAMEWLKPALHRIAAKTPATVLEDSQDSIASDVEYNPVIRADYAETVSPTDRSLPILSNPNLGHIWSPPNTDKVPTNARTRCPTSFSWPGCLPSRHARR